MNEGETTSVTSLVDLLDQLVLEKHTPVSLWLLKL